MSVLTFLTDSIVIGMLESAPIVLAAMGFTLIYYLNGFINVAYAENVTLGAYFAIVLNTILGVNFFVAIIPAALLAGGFSVLTYVAVFKPAAKRGIGPTEMIIFSVGLSYFVRYLAILIFSQENYFFEITAPQYLSIFGIGITSTQLLGLGLVAVTTAALYFFIYNSDYGERMRGLANNEDLAMVSGINPSKISILIWFIAGTAAGLAGVFFGVFSVVTPRIGFNAILIIIMVSIVGGIGNVRGALVAAIGAGIITAGITLLTKPLYAEVLLLLFFIAILKIKNVRD